MASDSESPLLMTQQGPATRVDRLGTPVPPDTPTDTGLNDDSQLTLLSTEIPQSPIDPNDSFRTEINDDRVPVTVIPSSLTPPPSTQVNNHATIQNGLKRTFSGSQQSTLFSPPATILNTIRDRIITLDYAPPASQQVLDASADELRVMLQTCIAENQKLKMETAHHKLQFNLLSLQADDDQKRAAVEHDMVRREVDALRTAEHTRQAKRELSATSDATQAKYLQMKMMYDEALDEVQTLQQRVRLAKKVIQQKEEETVGLTEERNMLLNRIRENREHLQKLCSPGGIFHGAITPVKQVAAAAAAASTPHQQRQTPRSTARMARDGEHGLSALLQAMSQDNNSAPSTPLPAHRPAPRQPGRHSRNAQSMSSLPTTPMNRPAGHHGGLLPSVDLVPHTEPQRYQQSRFLPTTPVDTPDARRKSRESTISVEDTEELARQAMDAAQSFASQVSQPSQGSRSRRVADEQVYDSQASQAATELLRRDARQSFEVRSTSPQNGNVPAPAERSARMQAKFFPGFREDKTDKRKFSGSHGSGEEVRRDQGSPAKKSRPQESMVDERRRLGLGIRYSQ